MSDSTVSVNPVSLTKVSRRKIKWKAISKNWELYLFVALPIIWLLIFMYYRFQAV